MKPIKLGLIGVGGFGERHLEAIRVLEQAGEIKLEAVADPQVHGYADLAQSLRKNKIRIYEDYNEMLANEFEIKAVSIAAPIPYHFEIAKRCIENDLYIYLEKPPSPLLEQLVQLIKLDVKHRVIVGFQLVESIWSQQVKNWIVSGKLGTLREIRTCACWPRPDSYYKRARWVGRMNFGGLPTFDGPATNALSHLIHNIMFFAGDELESFARPSIIQAELYRIRPIESYDTVCLRGSFESGVSFHAALTHATEESLPFQMEMIGTKGKVCVSQDGNLLESNCSAIKCEESVRDLMVKAYRGFIEYVRGQRPRPPNFLQDAIGYTLATNAMLVSSGGTHEVGAPWRRRIQNDGDGIYSVDGLRAIISEFGWNPKLFSALDLPWSVKTPAVAVAHFKSCKELLMAKPPNRAKDLVQSEK